MIFENIKKKLLNFFPKRFRKQIKNFYYDGFILPGYALKYKLAYGIWDFFDSIAIETTTHCNLRCKFCPNSKYDRGLLKNKKLMEEELFKKIISELAEMNYSGWILLHFYGEPLTDERIPSFVSYIKQNLPRAKVQINTNGILLTPFMYGYLIKSGVKRFFITQYGKEIPPNIQRLFQSLKDSKKKKILYRVLGKDFGLSNRGGEMSLKETIDFERPSCLYPNNSVIIDHSGKVVLCCNDYHSSVSFGNLEEERLVDIWNKSVYKKLRKELRNYKFKLPLCRKCVGLN